MTVGPSCSLPSPFSVPPPIIGCIGIGISSGIGMGITGGNRGAQRLVRSPRVKHLQKKKESWQKLAKLIYSAWNDSLSAPWPGCWAVPVERAAHSVITATPEARLVSWDFQCPGSLRGDGSQCRITLPVKMANRHSGEFKWISHNGDGQLSHNGDSIH